MVPMAIVGCCSVQYGCHTNPRSKIGGGGGGGGGREDL